MRRWLTPLLLTAMAAGLCWAFPLFRIVPLERAAREKAAATFDPKAFAGTFWKERLIPSLDQAADARALLQAIRANPAEARKRHGRTLGLSDSYTFFLSGTGRVLEVTPDEIHLAISDDVTQAEVSLQVGLLFSSAVRDGTGLLNVNDFPDSQDFNAISEALNQIVETQVQPSLRESARVGSRVQFAGCAEVNDEATDLQPLKVIPIRAVIQ
jgi:predicted lipoprotein